MKYGLSTFKLLTTILLTVFLHGCIGIGISWVGDVSSAPTQIPVLSNKKWLFAHQGQPLSSDYVVSQWGEPDHRKQIDGDGEVWEYHGNSLRWHGMGLAILLPLPLVIPFGYNYVTLVIQDGHVRSAVETYWGSKFEFFCGYAFFKSDEIKCFKQGRAL